jgi:IS5 family transposase
VLQPHKTIRYADIQLGSELRVCLCFASDNGPMCTILQVTPPNKSEVKSFSELLREDDEVVYGDAAYLGMEQCVQDDIKRDYRICRNMGVYSRFRKGELSYRLEDKMVEQPKRRIRKKIEYVFHIVKDVFHWRKARYKGIQKNTAYANILFASANLYMCAKAGGIA